MLPKSYGQIVPSGGNVEQFRARKGTQMTYCKIEATSTVTVHNHRNLLAAWKMFGKLGVVGAFVCAEPLTEYQVKRLPAALRGLLVGVDG